MYRTMSVTQARDNFPALVRQVASSEKPVIITRRNQPKVVVLDYETFQQRQRIQVESARALLQRLVEEALRLIESTREAPDSVALQLFLGSFEQQTRDMWLTGRSISRPVRSLATVVHNGILNLRRGGEQPTISQLDTLAEVLPLLLKPDLSIEEVAEADLRLLNVGLNAVFPVEGDLVSLYERPFEEDM